MGYVYQLEGDSNIVIHSKKYLSTGDLIDLPWGLVEITNKTEYRDNTTTELEVREYTPQAAVSVTKLKKISDAPMYLTLSAGYKIVHGSNEIMIAEDKRMREVLYLMRQMWPDTQYYEFENRTLTLY